MLESQRGGWKGIAAQFSTIEPSWLRPCSRMQLAMREVSSENHPPSILSWGAAQLKIISTQLSTIEAQLITDDSASKIAMSVSVCPP